MLLLQGYLHIRHQMYRIYEINNTRVQSGCKQGQTHLRWAMKYQTFTVEDESPTY